MLKNIYNWITSLSRKKPEPLPIRVPIRGQVTYFAHTAGAGGGGGGNGKVIVTSWGGGGGGGGSASGGAFNPTCGHQINGNTEHFYMLKPPSTLLEYRVKEIIGAAIFFVIRVDGLGVVAIDDCDLRIHCGRIQLIWKNDILLKEYDPKTNIITSYFESYETKIMDEYSIDTLNEYIEHVRNIHNTKAA